LGQVPVDRSITVPAAVAVRHSVHVAWRMGAGWCKVRAHDNTLAAVVAARAGVRIRGDGSGDERLRSSTSLSRVGDSGHDSWAPLAPQEQQEQQEVGMPTCHHGAWVFLAFEHPSSGMHTATHMVERTLGDSGAVKCASQTLQHCQVEPSS
jgi:hypothetical protein